MADPSEFSAADLDHLEDALEELEFVPLARDAAPHLRRRLDDYRNILTLSRAAMPNVEIPRGLLDGVLAQARASCEQTAITPASGIVAPERPGFWAKLRRFGLLPGVALAGTAAIVLLMVERKPEVAASGTADAKVAVASEPEAPKREQAAASESAPTAPSASPESPAPAITASPATVAAQPSPPPSPSVDTLAPGGPRKAGASKDDLDLPDVATETNDEEASELGAVRQEEKKAVDAETPRWDIIARADRARHRGDCDAARNEYALALDDIDARVRARAHAGLGLCDAVNGDRSSADAAYKAARELDGEIVAFIDDERPRAGSGGSGAKAKPKAATKKSEPKTDAME